MPRNDMGGEGSCLVTTKTPVIDKFNRNDKIFLMSDGKEFKMDRETWGEMNKEGRVYYLQSVNSFEELALLLPDQLLIENFRIFVLNGGEDPLFLKKFVEDDRYQDLHARYKEIFLEY